ncbi:RNA-binding protein NOB1 [Amborella trichopoda]|uniref:RNA-binding protein NOB1 n=1 Tax=Amborella trichopoda TaxID=13333 RepID=W1NYY6_AMBTC|nr:RNA-binding protein NOB1 [Amborella trichopoda]ERM99904.1 hypothetical protein AMTR_s00110p00064100 [Amborella trichopoda]|eukprot:XP_006837051.1 RNA-binding protein NOB1 [Amborella trichopoda]
MGTERAAGGWSDIVKKGSGMRKQGEIDRVLEDCKSSKGISIAVIDANAMISGGEKLSNCAEKFVSIKEALEEIRDPVSRHKISFLPFTVETMEPSEESLKKVVSFARTTGDLQTLSDVDLKLIALSYTLEARIHGTAHLRDVPPPVHVVNVSRLPEKDMPGWGSNVPNLEEWEALEHAVEGNLNENSRILPLKNLTLNVPPASECVCSEDNSPKITNEAQCESLEESGQGHRKHIRFPPKKIVTIEGKKMVADGIDASKGEVDENDEWYPAVSRSTHRRYLRRKARREALGSCDHPEIEGNMDEEVTLDDTNIVSKNAVLDNTKALQGASFEEPHLVNKSSSEAACAEIQNGQIGDGVLDQEEDLDSMMGHDELLGEGCVDEVNNFEKDGDDVEVCTIGLDHLEIMSQFDGSESINASQVEDSSSEQSWMLRSLSDSSVACVTSDYAMQNVLLQMGLRLLTPTGMQIRQLHRWVLKCHACNRVTAEIGRIFCPKCGNGGTLRKVAVTVGESGVVQAARRPRIILRGTKFSLPSPQGGRDAITKNPILREDQLPHKLLYPKLKKKPANKGLDILSSDDVIFHSADKRASLKPPVRKAVALFSGKRNPNDNHFSRGKK